MNKFIIATMFSSTISFGVNTAKHGQGVINFKGTVIDAPCGIAEESADQTINFGQISKAHLNADGISVKKDLDIKLVNCDATEIGKLTNGVKVSFTDTTINGQNQELGTTDDTGTAIVVSAANGSLVSFDGTAGSATKVKEDDFTAVANFNLAYE
ncbi:fimbrial protein [Escherichia coli]|uniref:fimbrial protein n=1 Tax=Escherichia coli TaxID=562 RepID=UPI00330F53A5|nr:type 1 fimbrial protein [Escherichia coli]